MKWKPDWPEAAERLTALWRGEPLDRACIAIRAPRDGGVPPPAPTAEARWLDPDWLLKDVRATLANTWWGGEAVPSYLRTVQAAGKIVHISVPAANVEPLVKSLDRRLLMLDTYCRTVAEGEALLASLQRWG